MQFDYPDANVHAERRSVTTTPTQKLYLLNNPFVLERASTFQGRLGTGGDSGKVQQAYRLLYGRDPEARELKTAESFLARPNEAELSRWQQLAQALLVSNEFMYVD